MLKLVKISFHIFVYVKQQTVNFLIKYMKKI